MTRTLLFLLFGSILLVGCQPKEVVEKPTNQPESGGAANPIESKPEEPPKPTVSLPANLKHDGLLFFGLDSAKTVSYEVTDDAGDVRTGTQKSELVEVKDGKGIYQVTRTGSFGELLGEDQQVVVTDKGVLATEIKGQKIDPPQMEMPAELKPGTTWSVANKFTLDGRKFEQKNTYKAIKVEQVKTKAGSYECMLIEIKGSVSIDGQKMDLQTKAWFSKSIGEVKIEMTTKVGGKDRKFVIEAVSVS
ncbi:MAG TPA: hypothetical protein PKA27_00755 [Fimbriimonadaceae bacterium]|nr:hypothetical protein [Fimbriimonadaceae bacterium]